MACMTNIMINIKELVSIIGGTAMIISASILSLLLIAMAKVVAHDQPNCCVYDINLSATRRTYVQMPFAGAMLPGAHPCTSMLTINNNGPGISGSLLLYAIASAISGYVAGHLPGSGYSKYHEIYCRAQAVGKRR